MNYTHKVQYYETDKMAVVHHSNYIRWMEEARVFYLDKAGVPFDKLEEMGLVCPVTEVSCKYISSARFGDNVNIEITLLEFKGVKMRVGYTMRLENSQICCTAESAHCFIYEGKIINLKKKFPEIYQKITNTTLP